MHPIHQLVLFSKATPKALPAQLWPFVDVLQSLFGWEVDAAEGCHHACHTFADKLLHGLRPRLGLVCSLG